MVERDRADEEDGGGRTGIDREYSVARAAAGCAPLTI